MSGLDGDHSAKSMDSGANSAMNATSEFSDSIHENAHQATAAGEKTTGGGNSVFDKTGAIGKQFTSDSYLWALHVYANLIKLMVLLAELLRRSVDHLIRRAPSARHSRPRGVWEGQHRIWPTRTRAIEDGLR